MTDRRLAAVYHCPHERSPGSGWHHDRGNGKPPRKRCSGCGGNLAVTYGLHGVFAWQGGSGRYRPEDAVTAGLFSQPKSAQRHADRLNEPRPGHYIPEGGFVVRFLPEAMLRIGGDRDAGQAENVPGRGQAGPGGSPGDAGPAARRAG